MNNIANDFINSFLSAYPEAREGRLSIAELNSLMAEFQQKMNNSPLDHFDGLSADQMEVLLYAPLNTESSLKLKADAPFHKVPFLKLSDMLIAEIQKAGSLKLTVNGNLPIRICEMLCDQNLIYWPYRHLVKRVREEEVPYLWPLKEYLLNEGIIKKRHNALTLTKNGEKLLKEPPAARFRSMLNYLVSRFHWGNFYPVDEEGRYGQLGWAYSLLLLARYGDTPRKSDFYSHKLIEAFEPDIWDEYREFKESKAVVLFQRSYEVRFFENFASWFGLVDIALERDYSISYRDQLTVTKSELFDQLFEAEGKR